MSSLSLFNLREQYSGLSEEDIAKTLAEKYQYVAIVRYKNQPDGPFTNFGCCDTQEKLDSYFESPYCHDTELIYDGRKKSLFITEKLILQAHCDLCGKAATRDALVLGGGDDYYACSCGRFFCDNCYLRLPLTNPAGGYGMCPECRKEVKRAVIGVYVS